MNNKTIIKAEVLRKDPNYVLSGILTSVKGKDGRGIVSILKTSTTDLTDTYTITYTDETTSTFNVENGTNGENGRGIVSILKTSTIDLVDTYTITYTDATTSTFTVKNGANGYTPQKGIDYFDGATPTIGLNKHWYINGVDTGIVAEGIDGEDGTSSVLTIGINGNFYINGVDTGQKAQGNDGNDGKGVSTFVLHSIVGKVKTYRMTFTDLTFVDIPITDGTDGKDGKPAYQYAVDGGYTGTEAEFTTLFNAIDSHIEDAAIHVSSTQKTNIDKLDFGSELGADVIDETNDKLGFWDNSALKFIKLSFAKLKTWITGFSFIQGGNSFGAKAVIGTNDNRDFAFKTNGIERAVLAPNGTFFITGLIVGSNSIRCYGATDGILSSSPSTNGFVIGNINYATKTNLSGVNRVLKVESKYNQTSGTSSNIDLTIDRTETAIGSGAQYLIAALVNNNYKFVVDNLGRVGIAGVSLPKSALDVNGGVRIGDDTDAASIDKEGTIRYRKGTGFSVAEMCMADSATTFSWVEIQRMTW